MKIQTMPPATTPQTGAAGANNPMEKSEVGPHDRIDFSDDEKEKTGFARWFFESKRVPGKDTQGSPFNKLTLGMVAAAGLWAGSKVVSDIAGSPSVGAAIGKVAVNLASLGAGYLAADIPSGLLHHWADNYAQPDAKNAFIRKFAKQAQRHHFHPTKLGHYSLSYWASPLSIVGWVPLAAGAALGLPSPLLSGTIGLIGGMSVYGKYHQWSHMKQEDVPAHGKLLQKMRLAIDPHDHNVHHKLPWNSDYCIVHGHLNGPLNAVKFWPRYEKTIYALTGAKPESWNVPEYKAYVDGKISKEEYIAGAKKMMLGFRNSEMLVRKEKWGIDG